MSLYGMKKSRRTEAQILQKENASDTFLGRITNAITFLANRIIRLITEESREY